jgi:hypothetical protein
MRPRMETRTAFNPNGACKGWYEFLLQQEPLQKKCVCIGRWTTGVTLPANDGMRVRIR